MTPFRLGYKPDTADQRDHRFAKLGTPTAVPEAASLRAHVVEVLDQQQTSSCVAHSWAQALRIADVVAGIQNPQLSSREFIYYHARAFDGGPIVDEGSQLRSGAKAVTKFGRPPESAWPFIASKINEHPSWEAYREAYDHKGPAGYVRLSGLSEIKQAIAAGSPVVGGTSVGDSIFDVRAGTIYDPSPSEASVGGHALCIVGYDALSFTIVNSWGPDWCDKGFFRVSPRFMAGFTDLWSVHQ